MARGSGYAWRDSRSSPPNSRRFASPYSSPPIWSPNAIISRSPAQKFLAFASLSYATSFRSSPLGQCAWRCSFSSAISERPFYSSGFSSPCFGWLPSASAGSLWAEFSPLRGSVSSRRRFHTYGPASISGWTHLIPISTAQPAVPINSSRAGSVWPRVAYSEPV